MGSCDWTTASSSATLVTIILLALLLAPSGTLRASESAPGHSTEGFARWLFDQGDYYRAISVYKELIYFGADSSASRESSPPEAIARYELGCGESYRKSGRQRSALTYYARVIESTDTAAGDRTAARIGMGLVYTEMSLPSTAVGWFEEAVAGDSSGVAAICKAQAVAEIGKWDEAGREFQDVSTAHPALAAHAGQLADLAITGGRLPQKNRAVAACLSAILPGSGQWYAGHHYDALLAFSYVGTMAGATYAFWRLSEETDQGPAPFYISAAVTSFLHVANILGAKQTVQYRNMRVRQDHIDRMRRLALPETVLPMSTERSGSE